MKKWILAVLFMMVLACSQVWGANRFYGATGLTGGASGDLDSIDGINLEDGDVAYVVDADADAATPKPGFYVYRLNATSGASESIPGIISPNVNAGNKRWIKYPFYNPTISGATPILTLQDVYDLRSSSAFGATINFIDSSGNGAGGVTYSYSAPANNLGLSNTIGGISLNTGLAGSSSNRIKMTYDGNIGINTPDQFGSGVKVIGIADATTTPTTTPTGAVVLYSDGGELKVLDDSGNTTTLSPHADDYPNTLVTAAWPRVQIETNHYLNERRYIAWGKVAELVQAMARDKGLLNADQYVTISETIPGTPRDFIEDAKNAWKTEWIKANSTETEIPTEQDAEKASENVSFSLPKWLIKQTPQQK